MTGTAVTTHPLPAMVLTAAAGLSACSLSLVSGERPVVTIGAAAAAAVVAAVLSGWRWLGSAATLAATTTVLLAAAISSDRVLGWHLVAASALLLGLVIGLDRVERSARSPGNDVVWQAPVQRRIALPLVALAASGGVAVIAARPVVPSVGLVLLGLAAGIAALVVATRTS